MDIFYLMSEKETWIETAQTETYDYFWWSGVFLYRQIHKLTCNFDT